METERAPLMADFSHLWLVARDFDFVYASPELTNALLEFNESISYLTPEEQTFVWEAANVAMYLHQNQKRNSGEPYSDHCARVVIICAKLKLGPQQLAAAWLHDTVEDCSNGNRQELIDGLRVRFGDRVIEPVLLETTLQDIRKKHVETGDERAWIMEEYKKIGKKPNEALNSKKQVDELYRLQLLHNAIRAREPDAVPGSLADSERDVITALVMKLADRLHNMRTIGSLTLENKKKNAEETMEIYVKLAKRLGLWEISEELENISYGILYPKKREVLEHMNIIRQTAIDKKPTLGVVSKYLPESLRQNEQVDKRLILPNAAAMCENEKPFLILDIGIGLNRESDGRPTKRLREVKDALGELIPFIRQTFAGKKSIYLPDIPTIMKLLKRGILNTVSIAVPFSHTDFPEIKQLRINVMTHATFEEEAESIHHAISWESMHAEVPADRYVLAVRKWNYMQKHFQHYTQMYSRMFKTLSSAEMLLALTQRVPVGMMLVIGAPPDGRPQMPWLVKKNATVGDFMRTIAWHDGVGPRKIFINGLPASNEHVGLMPFDVIKIS